jgi:hypothetical protein
VPSIAVKLVYPQFETSYINVKLVSHTFVTALTIVSAIYWTDIAHQDPGIAQGLACPPARWASLIVQDDTQLDAAAVQVVSDILTGALPDLPASDLQQVFFGKEPGSGLDLVGYCRLLGLQDQQLMAAWADSPRLRGTEAERLEILQWLTTRHHFPLRTLAEPTDVTVIGPQVVWALVWLHHHVLGALEARRGGHLTSGQLADIFEVAGRCGTYSTHPLPIVDRLYPMCS